MINLKSSYSGSRTGDAHVARHRRPSLKEMLPIVDKPMVQYIVDEIVAAGIKEIVLVTHASKNAVENHFDTSYELGSAAGAARQTPASGRGAGYLPARRDNYERAPGSVSWAWVTPFFARAR